MEAPGTRFCCLLGDSTSPQILPLKVWICVPPVTASSRYHLRYFWLGSGLALPGRPEADPALIMQCTRGPQSPHKRTGSEKAWVVVPVLPLISPDGAIFSSSVEHKVVLDGLNFIRALRTRI